MSTYRLDRGFALQLFGWRLVIAAVFVLTSFVLRGFGVTTVSYVMAAAAAVMVFAALLLLLRPPIVARLRADGFSLGRITRATRRSAPWTQVEQVDTVNGEMLFAFTGGTTTKVPLVLLPAQAGALQRDVSERLNAANGYRRLN